MIYFEERFLTIRHDTELNVLFSDWNGKITSDEFRAGVRKILELIEEHNIPMWFSNSRNMRVLSVMDQRWSNEFFSEALKTSPLKKVVRVLSDEIIHQLVINNLIEHAVENNALTIEFGQFTDHKTALKWLLSDVTVK